MHKVFIKDGSENSVHYDGVIQSQSYTLCGYNTDGDSMINETWDKKVDCPVCIGIVSHVMAHFTPEEGEQDG